MIYEKGHVPANKGGGKKIDADVFMENFGLYITGQINQMTFAKNVGISVPTLHKRLCTLFENGYIDGVLFTNGKPLGVDRVNEVMTAPPKVVYPVL